jgi:hypothetical protein
MRSPLRSCQRSGDERSEKRTTLYVEKSGITLLAIESSSRYHQPEFSYLPPPSIRGRALDKAVRGRLWRRKWA